MTPQHLELPRQRKQPIIPLLLLILQKWTQIHSKQLSEHFIYNNNDDDNDDDDHIYDYDDDDDSDTEY